MPFTFSHPAIILPFSYLPKRWVSMTGLIIGSMAPDFEYFFRMKVYSLYSHKWTGLFWFDLPLTIILAFIFHLILRNSLVDNLPTFLNNRLIAFRDFNWTKYFKKNFLAVIISCLIGGASHILWDSFTHKNGQFVQSIDELTNTVIISGYSIPVYKMLQHFSTIVGGLIVIYSLLQFPKTKLLLKQKATLPFWVLVGLTALLIVTTRLLTGLNYKDYGDLIITIMTGTLVGLVLTSILKPSKV